MKYRSNKGLKKRCDCARRTWETCEHPWFFNFTYEGVAYRESLDVASRDDARKKFDEVKVAIRNGTYQRPTVRRAVVETPAAPAVTFAAVADHFRRDPEGLDKLSASVKRQHGYDMAFLGTVVVPPGVPFTEKPFADIIRADIKLALQAKQAGALRTYRSKNGVEWTRQTGGKVASNRMHDYLRSLWNWAIEERYVTSSPFIRTRKGKNRLKHDELARNRRLREGEEAGLLAHANPHLSDLIEAALASAMRVTELLSLQWRQVSFLRNEIHLPGGKTKSKRDRIIPLTIKPRLREVLVRRQKELIAALPASPSRSDADRIADLYAFGDEVGQRVKSVSTAWEHVVLRSHGVTPERTRRGGSLTVACREALAEIDLHFHDLRHECASRLYFEEGWTIYDVSSLLGHADVKTTERYLGVADKTKRLHELVARQPLALVKG